MRKLINTVAWEAIALVLSRPDASRQYLYPQIFSDFSHIIALSCLSYGGFCVIDVSHQVSERRGQRYVYR